MPHSKVRLKIWFPLFEIPVTIRQIHVHLCERAHSHSEVGVKLQDHYDYGMRAVKSVITAAGNLKRAYPDENEDVLLLRGLRDVNVPKFLAQDLPLFSGIILDLFPGVEPPTIVYDSLLGALAKCCLKSCLQLVPLFTEKVMFAMISLVPILIFAMLLHTTQCCSDCDNVIEHS